MSPVLRWTRALLLAGVALSTGSLAHASAGGLLPGPVAMTVLLLVGTGICAPLLGRPASRARVVLLVALGQSLVHVVLTALVGHVGDPVAATRQLHPVGAGQRTGTFFDQTMPPPTEVALSTPPWITHLVAELSGPHAFMAVTHLAAAVLVGLWLASGEQALLALLQLGVARALPEILLPAPLPRLATRSTTHTPLVRLWRDAFARRGPPYSFA
ncbi:MAG TPA: hypothetical protein VFK52_12170 [Nocardioidaceae bacterium]|nr:hypothetical protein [Nocardioidaceae bacterium]